MKRIVLYWSLIAILALIALVSCRSAQWHLNKFEQKGGKISPEIIRDSVPYEVKGMDGRDSLIYIPVEIKVDCPELETNAQTKAKERTKRTDSRQQTKRIGKQEKTAQTEAKEQTKQVKSHNKTQRTEKRQDSKTKRAKLTWWIWLIIGWILGICTVLIIWIWLLRNSTKI